MREECESERWTIKLMYRSLAQVIDQHPEVLDLLVELGFKPLANPIMRNTVGRKVSLKQGSKLEGTPMEKIVRTLEANGYEVVGLD